MRVILFISVLFFCACQEVSDRPEIRSAALPPENLQLTGGKTVFVAVQTGKEINKICGKKTYGCVIGKSGSKDTVLYMANPCLYKDAYAKALCHEWGHVMQFEMGVEPNHRGYQK